MLISLFKEQTWKNVAEIYSSECTSHHTAKQLKTKYEKLKAAARAKVGKTEKNVQSKWATRSWFEDEESPVREKCGVDFVDNLWCKNKNVESHEFETEIQYK